jgi:hypothetical protein
VSLRPFAIGGAVLLVLLLIAVAGLAVNEYVQELCKLNWSTYVSEAGGFSVQLPESAFSQRVKRTRQIELTKGLFQSYTFEGVTLLDGSEAGVFYFDLPSPTSDLAVLKRVMRLLERQHHEDAVLKTEHQFILGESTGLEAVYKTQKGKRSVPVYSRWLLAGRRVYEIAWMPNGDSSPSESRQTMWNSFRLLTPDSETGSFE